VEEDHPEESGLGEWEEFAAVEEVGVLVVVFSPILKERVVIHQEVAGEVGDEEAAQAESRETHENFLADRRCDEPDHPIL